MKPLVLSLALTLAALPMTAQPKREVRAVWLTTNSGLDWPCGETSASLQKQSLVKILDRLSAANFNTIIFQAQVKGDVAWESSYQPTMRWITGNGSKNMSYDVSRFVIDECHKRNMECHAWIVPYRIGTATEAAKYSSNPLKHVYLTHPEFCKKSGNDYYLDPGDPAVRSYLLDVYRELISNYDYDGVNFDYTRYPSTDGLPDDDTYAAYNPDGLPRGDWRRQNINTFIAEFYEMAKSLNPDIKVGAAPIGCYKNLPGYSNMTAYGVYQDACQWMQSGNHDLLIPQMYWNETYGFSPHMGTWVNNCAGRQLVVGIAPYKMVDGSNDWEPDVIYDQIEKIRAKDGMSGVCFFRTEHVIGTDEKEEALYNKLQNDYFKYPAHIPTMDYNGVTTPDKPQNVTQEYSGGQYLIKWEAPADSETDIRYYSLYLCDGNTVDINNPEKVVAHIVKDNEFTYPSDNPDMVFAVTAFDKGYFESAPAIASTSGVDDALANQSLFRFANQTISIDGNNEIDRVEIYSTTGAHVKQTILRTVSASIDCSYLPKGLYIVRTVYSNGGVNVNKILR